MATKSKKLELPDTQIEELVAGNVKDAMKNVEAGGEGGIRMVDPTKLRRLPGFSGRIRTPEYIEHVHATKRSIVKNGFYRHEPLVVFAAVEEGEDVLYLVDGHTRHEGALLAIEEGHEIKAVPTIATPRGTTMADLVVMQAKANNGGRSFTPLEMGYKVKQLQGYGLEDAEIAERLDISEKYVGDLLLLVGAPRKLIELVATEKIAPTLAIDTLKKEKGDAVAKLVAAVEKAKAEGKEKATAKHVEKSPKKAAKKAQKLEVMGDGTTVTAGDVLAYFEKAGFVRSVDLDAKLLKACRFMLDEIAGITVEGEVDENDPSLPL